MKAKNGKSLLNQIITTTQEIGYLIWLFGDFFSNTHIGNALINNIYHNNQIKC